MLFCLRTFFVRIFTFSPALGLFVLLSCSGVAQAQSYFVPLERGDYTEREEHLTFSPGVELSGDFRFRTSKIKSTALPLSRAETNSPEEFSFDQDIRLRLRSTVHRIISLNLELATNQEPIYQSDIRTARSSRTTGAESQTANISARQSYLELNRNPNEETKIGKQVINIGDRKGKVFAGILSGYTQRCKAGTWCYEIGGMKLSSADGDWLYFFSLDYPFWHEVDSQGEIIDSFRLEMFRIKYTEHDVPLGLIIFLQNVFPAVLFPVWKAAGSLLGVAVIPVWQDTHSILTVNRFTTTRMNRSILVCAFSGKLRFGRFTQTLFRIREIGIITAMMTDTIWTKGKFQEARQKLNSTGKNLANNLP